MKTRHSHRLMVGLFKHDGTALGQAPVAPDWEPAVEAVRLCAQRRLGLAAIGADAAVEFRPVWQTSLGEPYLSALDTVLAVPGRGEVSCRLPAAYFKSLATAASVPLVSQGLLQSGESFDYLVMAFPDTTPALPAARGRFVVEEIPVPLPLKASAMDGYLSRAVECGDHDPQDIRVFLPQGVLDEADAMTRQSPAIEVASVLIGHLHRDLGLGEIFLEVTAQVPARNSQGTSVRVTFGPDTYQAVDNAIALRGQGEQWLGWLHSHPASAWCNPQCSPEARAVCPLQRVFFSADDCDVHRTLFPKAYCIALLVTNTDAGLLHTLFSWRNGLIVQRGFHILDGHQTPCPAGGQAAAATIGDKENEKPCSG
jgi:proteasome lid subunit RPN8/RPN11